MTEPVEHVIVGPARHGVVRFGVELHAALRAGGFATVSRRTPNASALTLRPAAHGRGVHLQFTDRLFGVDAQQAISVVRDLIADVHRGGGRVTATLHDVPQRFDRANYATRAHVYAVVSSLLDGVVVSSEHERLSLREISGVQCPITVIPLPIAAPVLRSNEPAHPASVAVFGFVYPDKGHVDVLTAMRGLPADIGLTAIGEASPGHDDLVDRLDGMARAQDRPFVLTGHVPDDALPPILQSVTVPVVHHRHLSASGSLNSWISAGRRPLAPASQYFREIARRNPTAVLLHPDEPGALAVAIRAALHEPSSTWLPSGTVCSPTPAEAAEGYRRLLSSVHR